MKLTELKNRQSARVAGIEGGTGVERRLEALGIKPGIEVTVISSHFWGGPVTIQVGKSKISVGRGMAGKITVEKH
ncbi:MAG: ferrous iron transport protein A [Candidatus Omnitrophica bacterium]|nr:ferrous iron transport protein A [Candidatus Omnitrophota bacterium]